MIGGPKRCGNCRCFVPMRVVNGINKTSHCSVREHNYYGALVPGDSHADTGDKPRQTGLPVTADNNSQGGCDSFEPDYEAIKVWREEEEKTR